MYKSPVDEIAFTLKHVAGLKSAVEKQMFDELSEDLIDAILVEAGRFASDEIAPLSAIGDTFGTPLKGDEITTPPGWKELYANWIEGGWNGICSTTEYGGQGLPHMLLVATLEMWNSGSLAFGIGPTLTMGACEAIDKHASKELKDIYLEKLISGEWMGTMNLTEPQAGSDLNALRADAKPMGDGRYKIFGQKIFITYGEHDFTENIIHLVLARLPNAPAGTRGISLFLVPKFHVNSDGSLGDRNDVFCSGIEHKLGIHASPTCTMIFGDGKYDDEPGAVGWLIGEENLGLACMFTMMNNARLAVGIQGVAVAEAAYQKALSYAHERTQGRSKSWQGEGMAPIIGHPDVQRNLMAMKTLTQCARSISYCCAHAIDMAHVAQGAGDEKNARHWQERAELLTPVAKAFSTDVGVDVASLGVQVHGGMGFIEETGAAQYLRDARIAPIYEGTNGIQAIDLIMRKLTLSKGEAVNTYIVELQEIVGNLRQSKQAELSTLASGLDDALQNLAEATKFIQKALADGDRQTALYGATPYLRLFGLVAGTSYLAKAALVVESDGQNDKRLSIFRFAVTNILNETAALKNTVLNGANGFVGVEETVLAL